MVEDRLEDRLQTASLLQGSSGGSSARAGAGSRAVTTRLQFSGVWDNLANMLSMLVHLIPKASSSLKYARQEVSKAASNLNSIFGIFEAKGPTIFNLVAKLWRVLWVLYYFFFVPQVLFLLYYGFWSSGWFGGPQPIPGASDPTERPQTWGDKLRVCWESCCVCCQQYHDLQLCLWSFIILMQILTLVLFVVSIALCITAGVKAFIVTGCSQIYILGDSTVCTATLGTLRQWVSSFFVADALEPLVESCRNNQLLTCSLISQKMKTSAMLTTACSFLATILSLQIVIDMAMLHEQARFRRVQAKIKLEESMEA